MNPVNMPTSRRHITGDAAFWAAVMAGVKVDYQSKEGVIIMTTAHPVDVWMDDGVIKVFVNPNTDDPLRRASAL